MKAIILTIGDELLIGQVVDTNSAWLAEQFTLNNIEVVSKITISDSIQVFKESLDYYLPQTDIIVTTGGLGPTNDDYTVEALSAYFGFSLEFHQPTWDRIEGYFKRRNKTPGEGIKKQCLLPVEMTKLVNDLGTAPGLYHSFNGKHIISLPGVPYEMKHLFTDRFLPIVKPLIEGEYLEQRTILTCGMGETDIAEKILDIETGLPQHINLAFLPDIGKVRLRLSGRGTDKNILSTEIKQIGDQIIERIGDCYYGEGKTHLVDTLRQMMIERNLTLGLAESCTGGHISDQIVSFPNASAFFNGSVVSYANEVKHNILGVNQESLASCGAVSEEVVKDMADGALSLLGVDIAASISGIAGPDGGSEDKPVGTFWMGLARTGCETRAFKVFFNRDRQRNIQFITSFVLNKIRLELLAWDNDLDS
ncbi:MAG: CinA family nicotinamide mononucleotide deamidase-related protein [Saprospiraceae bacterium]|nr:CinA family nicotinamide mononucleotide deamidase-related protein [Candidatus Brachybacter algidus]